MKSLAKFLTVVCAVAVAALLYVVLGSGLEAEFTVTAVPAEQAMEAFERVTGSREGWEGRQVVTIVARAKNRGPLACEWAELRFAGRDGDVAAERTNGGPIDIPAYQSGELSAVIVTGGEEAGRAVWVAYYLFGTEKIAQ